MTTAQKLSATEAAHRRYCSLYWEYNELQLISAEKPSRYLNQLMSKLVEEMAACVRVLGYTPAP